MTSHVCLGVDDFERAMVFYSRVMETLGLSLKFCDRTKPLAGWVTDQSKGDISGLAPPTWQSVMTHEYEPWTEPTLTIDTAPISLAQAVATINLHLS